MTGTDYVTSLDAICAGQRLVIPRNEQDEFRDHERVRVHLQRTTWLFRRDQGAKYTTILLIPGLLAG